MMSQPWKTKLTPSPHKSPHLKNNYFSTKPPRRHHAPPIYHPHPHKPAPTKQPEQPPPNPLPPTKPKSQPLYPLPLASEKIKSGIRSSSTASPPPPHSTLFSLRLKSSILALTSHALPGGSPQKPNVRTKQLLLWSSLLPAKTPQKKPSAEASHSLGRSSKSNAT